MASRDRPETQDATRREFFRAFGRQTVRQAGELAGAASDLRRNSLAAARELLDLGREPSASGSQARGLREEAQAPGAAGTSPDSMFRSPYRFTGEDIVVLDQRELPGRVTTFALREPSEIAAAIRSGAINSGPVLAEVAAYAMVLACGSAIGRNEGSVQQRMRAAAGTLRAARREVRALGWAVDRMEAKFDRLADTGADTADIRDGLLEAAHKLAADATAVHARIGRLGAAAIELPDGRPVNLLMHGDMGPLSCGAAGVGTSLIQALNDVGHPVHVWLTEASPTGEGARISTVQLTQLDIPHTVIPDTAVGWLFDHRSIDAVLLRGDRVCANGDCGSLIGSLAVARLAREATVPVHVLAPLASLDAEASDGAAIGVELRSAAEALAADRLAGEAPRPALFGVRLNPTVDVVPAALIDRYLTEAGALAPPFERSLSLALAEAT
jgi:methylthioribose-1-phosphate isomerase